MPRPTAATAPSWFRRWRERRAETSAVEDDAFCGTAFGLDLSLSQAPWAVDTGLPQIETPAAAAQTSNS